MRYAPHTLYKKVAEPGCDQWGNPIFGAETWIELGPCRCDDNTTKEFKTANGEVYRPSYHIVGENLDVKAGDEIRCMSGDQIRGEGLVFSKKQCNYLDYTELWV